MAKFNPDSYLNDFDPDAYISESEPTGDLGNASDAIVEPIKAIAGSVGTDIVAGLGGLAQTINPFAAEGAGAKAVEDIRAAAPDFSPQTQVGQASLETVGQLIEKGIDIVNFPLSGLEGLSLLIKGFTLDDPLGGLDKAVATIKDIQKSGLGQNLGNRALEGTGSPLLATIAELTPDITGIITGAPLAASAGRAAVTATPKALGKAVAVAGDIAGEAKALTGEVVSKGGELAKDVTGKVKEVAKDISRIQTPAKREIARQLQTGEIDKDLARFKLAEEGVTDTGIIQKALGIELSDVVLDKGAINASKQGFDNGFLDSVKKRASGADVREMLEMTKIAEKAHKDPLFGSDNRPADRAGNVLLEKFNAIKRVNRKAGKKIGDARKFLKGKVVPASSIGDNFLSSLDDLNITVKDGKLDFTDSLVSGGGRRRAINDIFGRMSRNKSPDALDLHELKQFIDETVSYGKTVRGLGGKAEIALKSLRSDIRATLEANFPDYAKANKAYSDTIDVLDEVQRLAGKKTDLTSDGAAGQLGVLSRRLMSNAQSRDQVRQSIKNLELVLDEHAGFGGPLRLEGAGGDKGPNIKLLMLYADELDKITGSAAKTSFTGGIETAIKATKGPKEFIAEKATEGARKIAGISEEGAFKSMREFLRSIDSGKLRKKAK